MEMNMNTTPDGLINNNVAHHIWQLPIVYIIGILGIIGNGTVFFVFLMNSKSMKKFSTLYIFHQTIIDFCSSVIFLAFRTHVYYQQNGYIEGTTWVEKMTCKLWYSGYILWAVLLTSNLNLMLLSVERYFAICKSVIHRNRYNAKRVKLSMGVAWVVGLTYKSYMIAVNDINEENFCTIQWKSKPAQSIVGVLTFFVEYLIPLSVMTFSYAKIIMKLKSLSRSYTLRRQAVSMSLEVTSQSESSSSSKPNQVTFTTPCQTTTRRQSTDRTQQQVRTSRSPTLVMFSKAKYNATKTLCFIFITFAVCWTPAEVEYLIDNFRSENQNCYEACESIVDIVVTNILLLNMVVNPLIYAISLKEFQDNFKKTFSSLRCPLFLQSIILPCKLQVCPSRRSSYSMYPQGNGAIQTISNTRNVVLLHRQLQQMETYHL